MNDREFTAAVVTAKLQGSPPVYAEILREEIIKTTIRRLRPWPLPTTWLDVCPLHDAAQALGVTGYIETEAYKLLHFYHCKGYFSVPRLIRRRIPDLVREALGVTE